MSLWGKKITFRTFCAVWQLNTVLLCLSLRSRDKVPCNFWRFSLLLKPQLWQAVASWTPPLLLFLAPCGADKALAEGLISQHQLLAQLHCGLASPKSASSDSGGEGPCMLRGSLHVSSALWSSAHLPPPKKGRATDRVLPLAISLLCKTWRCSRRTLV